MFLFPAPVVFEKFIHKEGYNSEYEFERRLTVFTFLAGGGS